MVRRNRAMPGVERSAELPSALFILSGTNPLRRAAMWIVRWTLFEWLIILTIIGRCTKNKNQLVRLRYREPFVLQLIAL